MFYLPLSSLFCYWSTLHGKHIWSTHFLSLLEASPSQSTSVLSPMAAPVEQWITDIPPVTRAWVAASIGTSVLVVSPARFG